MSKTYAYLLTDEKDAEAARSVMERLGIPKEHIYLDKRSSLRERPLFTTLFDRLEAHDILYVRSFDDLGYDVDEMRDAWYQLTKKKRAELVMVDYPLLDTRFRKEVNGSYIPDLVLCMMEYMSEKRWERAVLQRDGIERAKKEGVQFGRPEVKLPDKFETAYQAYRRKDITGTDAAKFCGMAVSTFYRKASEYEKDVTKAP